MGAGGFKGISDMIDGGGAGASGPMFEGGAISDIGNALGIKPLGYHDRQQAMSQVRPQMRPPMGGAPAMPPMGAPPVAPPAPSPVSAHPLPPQPGQPGYSPMMAYYQMLEMQRRQAGLI